LKNLNYHPKILVIMNLFLNLRYFSLLSLAAFSFIATAQIAQAETLKLKTTANENLALNQPSNSVPTTETVSPNDFRQLTSASNLNSTSTQTQSNNSQNVNIEMAQTEIEIDPGTTTRSGSSYIGLGGNIGIDGETTIGESSFAVISKIGLTDYLSFRPSALVEEDATFLFPLTVDFFSQEVSDTDFRVAPYVGGGLSIATGDGDTVGIVVTGGLDIPVSSELTANAAVNAKFIDSTDLGFLLGLGYNID
jgi:hypothetical protein